MKKRLFISTLAAALLLAGCVVAPTPYYDGPVYVDPPPPRVEYPGYAPVAGYIWIGGYWSWTGHRHEWVPGRWESPRHGHRWVAPRWERNGNYWRQQPGRWEQESDSRMLPPPPRNERGDERRPDPRPTYRQERGSMPAPVQGEPESHTLHPVFTGGAPVRAEPPRRDNERRSGPEAGSRPQRDVRPAPRVEPDSRGRDDRQRESRRPGRRSDDENH